jgi:predicted nucleic acid-binding protein
MKGNQRARKAIDSLETFSISSVSYMELIQGVRDKNELRVLQNFIAGRGIKILHVSTEISQRAIFYMEQFSLSHNLSMADALIASTAFMTKSTLLTANTKHYQSIKEIDIKSFRP